MRKKIGWFILLLAVIISILILNFGREKPPTEEVENAERALAEAKQKETDIYVPDIFSKAEETLKKTRALIQERKYKEAKRAAGETIDLAKQAISQVAANKAKLKAETDQMILGIRKGIGELKSLIVKPSKGVTRRERKELAELMRKWETVLDNIESLEKAEKIRQAHDQVVALKKEVDYKRGRFIPTIEEQEGIK